MNPFTPAPSGAPPGLLEALRRVADLLNSGLGARIGETAVVSTKVHVQDTNCPDDVLIASESDAGQVFYRRSRPGEVLHVDVFHSEGQVDPRIAAQKISSRLSSLVLETSTGRLWSSWDTILPYIDIQTALGGGRLTGSLLYGQEPGARQAHITHVHLEAASVPEIIAALFTIVSAVESSIEESGLELRKVRKVVMVRGGSPADASSYSASSDSLLREKHPSQLPMYSNSFYRNEALARQIARDLGSAEAALQVLQDLEAGIQPADLPRTHQLSRTPEEIRKILSSTNLVKYDGRRYLLTEDGRLALMFLKEHAREIDAYLRRLLWSLPARTVPSAQRKGHRFAPGHSRGRGVALPRNPDQVQASLDVPVTCIARGVRLRETILTQPDTMAQSVDAAQSIETARSVETNQSVTAPAFSYHVSDLRFSHVRENRSRPVILLLDASASMAGRRIAAAREVARHLVLTGRDRVAVIVFQDAEASIVCGYTRNLTKLEQGLASIQAFGLTPLARGLEKACELAARSARKPLVLCITDGIPTVPLRTLSPVDDALAVARNLPKKRIKFGCIGLEPNKSFLKELARAARGTLYIVEELDASTLAAIARRESS